MTGIESARSKSEIGQALLSQNAEIGEYLESFPAHRLLAPQGEKWSPDGHLRHLAKSVRAVTRGLRMPKLALAGLFGLSFRASRDFGAVRRLYLEALAAGGQAGRFGPSAAGLAAEPEEWKQIVLSRWRTSGEDLVAALAPWSEKALDRYRLPHPLLGKLTVREILYFTLYHNAHHARRVRERDKAAAP